MGIPREVAQLNQHNNFLFNSSNTLGPGAYEPDHAPVSKKAPAVGFGKLPGKYKNTTTEWEEKMEKYIGVKPSERKFSPKKEKSQSIMQSFEQQMRSKPSFMFQSPT